MKAIRCADIGLIKKLLHLGANPNVRNEMGQSAYSLAKAWAVDLSEFKINISAN